MIEKFLVKTIGKVAGKAIKAIFPGSEKAQETVEGVVNDILTNDEEVRQALEDHRKFILEYEGAMSTLPEKAQMYRASVRPTLTYLFTTVYVSLVLYGAFSGLIEFKDLLLIFGSNVGIIIGWWFAERAALKNPVKKNEG